MSIDAHTPLLVGAHMVPVPRSVAPNDTLVLALQVTRSHCMQHVPVLEVGRPVGVVSARDLALAERLVGKRFQEARVVDVMASIPYCTSPDAPVVDVIRHLSLRRQDVALVVSGGRVVGLFSIEGALGLLMDTIGANKEQTSQELMSKGVTSRGVTSKGVTSKEHRSKELVPSDPAPNEEVSRGLSGVPVAISV